VKWKWYNIRKHGRINMKKILLVLFTFVFVSSFCFAEEASTTVKKTGSKPATIQTFTGKVESLVIGSDPMIGNRSEIVLVDGKGQKMTFAVRSGIGVYSASSERLLTLNDIKVKDTVVVEYLTDRDGINKVQTIELRRY
jgi:hypothetical protein